MIIYKTLYYDKRRIRKKSQTFNIAIIKASENLPKNAAGYELAKQIIRSAGSVGSNYRAACRAKSTSDFIYKIEVIIEEADESLYWLEVIEEAGLSTNAIIAPLAKEANELVSIFVATVKTVKSNNKKS